MLRAASSARFTVGVALLGALALAGACSGGPPHRSPEGLGSEATGGSAPSTTSQGGSRPGPAASDWPTYDHDGARSGVDPGSPPLGEARVGWESAPLDGAVYAQPLVARSSVIVATENDSVYALDPSSGRIKWFRHLATPVPRRQLPCGDIDPSGITGTPVVDEQSGWVWVVTFSEPAVHTIWALDLSTGLVVSSQPADPPGADLSVLQQRGALLLASGRVYVPYGGLFGDCGNYHGWVLGFNVAVPPAGQPAAYRTPASRAGIWAPPGPVADPSGHLLVTTGNGLEAAVSGDANSVLKLDPGTLSVVDRFTAPNFAYLSQNDLDFGSTSPLLLRGGNIVQVGKDGTGYVLTPSLGPAAAPFHACAGGFGGGAVAGTDVYLSCFDGLHAFASSGGGPISALWAATGTRPGPPIVAGGVVWVVDRQTKSLIGFGRGNGKPVYRQAVTVVSSFPPVASSDGRLFVASGSRVVALTGI